MLMINNEQVIFIQIFKFFAQMNNNFELQDAKK